MLLIMILAFAQPKPPTGCFVDRCDEFTCSIETPEGWVEVPKKPHYYEGKEVVCPLWLIEPT